MIEIKYKLYEQCSIDEKNKTSFANVKTRLKIQYIDIEYFFCKLKKSYTPIITIVD